MKRWERSIRSSAPPPTQPDGSVSTQHPLVAWFSVGEEDLHVEHQEIPQAPMSEAEARLARDLRAAGLI